MLCCALAQYQVDVQGEHALHLRVLLRLACSTVGCDCWTLDSLAG
jgi:hypothetical protein